MCIRLLILVFVVSLQSQGQTHRIDSIRRTLPNSSGTGYINSLNALSREFNFYWLHSDSALNYADIAFKEAAAIKYDQGMVEALCMKAGVEGRLLGQPKVMETYARQAIGIAGKNNDPSLLSMANYYLGVALTIQGKYHDAEQPFNIASRMAIKSKDCLLIGWSEQGLGFMHFKSGEYWKSFEHLITAQQYGKDCNDSVMTTLSLVIIARTFIMAGDPKTALNYYYEAFRYSMPFIRMWSHHEDMANAHLQLKHIDSAEYYIQLNTIELETQSTDPKIRQKFTPFLRGYAIDIMLARKQYDSILLRALPNLQRLRNSRDVFPYMQTLFVLAKAYAAKEDYKNALKYSRELYHVARMRTNRPFLRDANELLSSLFARLNSGDSAYYYHKQYTLLKDSMETAQYAGRTSLYLAASEAENRIRLLKKDQQLKDQELASNKKELQKQSQVKNLFVLIIAIFFLLSLLLVRNMILKKRNEKLRSANEQAAWRRKVVELEMQALRAQMNPHFIFNCLSAIDNLIQTKQSDKATFCLSRFAKLIRGVLESSKNNLVSFQRDFETLQLYLEMEQFRCNNKFRYELSADPELLQGDFKVPPLIIQPFIENAIHHGLLNKEHNDRELKVKAILKDEHIVYYITDNGVGRKQAAALKAINRPDHQSYGLQITKERIQLHNRNGIEEDLVIIDLEKEGAINGTEAIVRINCSEN